MLNFFKKKIKVVTHNGSFHADEVLGCTALSLWADKNNLKLKILRSRDPVIIEQADIVLDVGMEYDPEKKRFDHHQKEGAGVRDNQVPYASFGLVWRHYGEEICESKEVANLVEEKLVLPIDARDNGVNISATTNLGIVEYGFGNALHSFNMTWLEDEIQNDKQFFEDLGFAKMVLEREIMGAKAKIEGRRLTREAVIDQGTPEVLILDKYFNWQEVVSQFKNIKFVIYPHRNEKDWCVETGRDSLTDYNSNRAHLPEVWWGLRDTDLKEVSGLPDAIFCARGGWFGVAGSKEGALQMAKSSLT